jgi:hypothetical protein
MSALYNKNNEKTINDCIIVPTVMVDYVYLDTYEHYLFYSFPINCAIKINDKIYKKAIYSFIPNMFDNFNNEIIHFITTIETDNFYKTDYLSSKIKSFSMYYSNNKSQYATKTIYGSKKYSCDNLPNSITDIHYDQTTLIIPHKTTNVKCYDIDFIKNKNKIKTINLKLFNTHDYKKIID